MADHQKKGKTPFVPNIVTIAPTMELQQLYAIAQGWDARLCQLSKQAVEVGIKMFHTPHLQYAQEYYSGSYMIEGMFPSDCVVVSLIRSKEIVSFKNQPLEEDQLVVLFPEEELDVLFHGGHYIFVLTIQKHFFETCFGNFFNADAKEMLHLKRLFMHKGDANRYIRHMHSWMQYFFQRDPAKVTFEEFLYIEKQILYDLFCSFDIQEPIEKEKKNIVFEARELLHTSLQEGLNVSEVAHKLGVNIRTLQYHFKKELGITPKQYLQSIKLHAIREELLHSSSKNMTVGEVAFKYHFYHLSHFANEYKQTFGESPSETLQKAL